MNHKFRVNATAPPVTLVKYDGDFRKIVLH